MPSALAPTVLAWTLGVGPMTPAMMAAEPGPEPRARLDVDGRKLGEDHVLDVTIADAVTTALTDEGVVVDGSAATTIEIDVWRLDDTVADFTVAVRVVADGEPIEDLGESSCFKCIDDFLVEHVVRRASEAVEILKRSGVVGEAVDPAAEVDEVDEQSATPPPSQSREPPPHDEASPEPDRTTVALVAAGSACAGLGLGALVGGASVWASGPRYTNSTTEPTTLELDDGRKLGYGLVGAGTVLIAGGAAMIGVAVLRRNRQRRPQAWLTPATGRQTWGVSLFGRF